LVSNGDKRRAAWTRVCHYLFALAKTNHDF
jgi:hypothetical protein